MSTLDKAIEIAAMAHAGQTRRNGTPYILHPIRVMLSQRTQDEMVVAILHDVVEDTDTTLDDLRRAGFGDHILFAISLLTHSDGTPYDDYIRRIAENPLAVSVKIADLEDNMNLRELPEVNERDEKRSAKYHKAWRMLRGE